MFLADTNVISEPRQKHPDRRVLEWLTAHEADIFISAITIAELQSGVSMLEDGGRKRALQEWLDTLLQSYRGSLLNFDAAVAVRWGHMNADMIRRGKRSPVGDSFLAATALHHNLMVATRNEKDFVGTGVRTVNPWTVE